VAARSTFDAVISITSSAHKCKQQETNIWLCLDPYWT